MKNKNYSALFLALFMTATILQAQDEQTINPTDPPTDTANLPVIETDPDAANIGVARVADESLTTVLLDDFEVPQGWMPNIPLDFGISKILYRDGAPKEIATDNNKMVLGVKTVFFKRNFGWMSVDRPYPLSLKNVVRSFSVWVSGRNARHSFFIKVRDLENNRMRLPGGEMRFQGWKKLVVPVSDVVVQYRPGSSTYGLEFLGFHVSFIAEDIVVTDPYYLYFDQLVANMNIVASQAADDISDNW
ncbi:MAG: flagellar filament outer layer protein FlaA [Brevinema sp.]